MHASVTVGPSPGALLSTASVGDRQPYPGLEGRDLRGSARGPTWTRGFAATHISVGKLAPAAILSAKDGTRATLLGHHRRTVSEPPCSDVNMSARTAAPDRSDTRRHLPMGCASEQGTGHPATNTP